MAYVAVAKRTSSFRPPSARAYEVIVAWCASAIAWTMASPSPSPIHSRGLWGLCPKPMEGLEHACELCGRDEPTGVGDAENRMFVLGAGFDFDSAAGEVVPRRIRDEVCGESLDKDRIAGGAGRFECDAGLEPAQVMSSERLDDGGRDVDGARDA